MRKGLRLSHPSNSTRRVSALVLIVSLAACFSFLLDSGASSLSAGRGGVPAPVNNGDPQQTKGQKNKNKCPNCAPPGDQSIYVPLIDLPEAQGSELVFNSRSTKDVAVTP